MQSLAWGVPALLSLSLLFPAAALAAGTSPDHSFAPGTALMHAADPVDAGAAGSLSAPQTAEGAGARPAEPGVQETASIGEIVTLEKLDDYRGGTSISSKSVSNGLVQDTTAVNVVSGKNVIADGAFAHASGLPVVIQNSGSNVLIQNSTIVNVQFR